MSLERLQGSFLARLIQKFIQDQATNWAVLIAWNALFAMFPILLFMAAVLGFVLSVGGINTDSLYDGLLTVIPDDQARREILEALRGVKQQTGLLSVVGLLGLILGGTALFGAMEQAFDAIYHTKPRPFVRQNLMRFGMVLLFTMLAGLAVGTSSLRPAVKYLPEAPAIFTSTAVTFALQGLIGALAGSVLFGAIYFFVPNRRQRWRTVWAGALLAGVLFELITLLFPTYLAINQSITAYGKTFALFFVLLTFFLLVGLITMLGVEVNSVLNPEPSGEAVGPTNPPTPAASQPVRGPRLPENGKIAPEPAQRGIRLRTAVTLAIAASVIGVLIRRRRNEPRYPLERESR